jgi:hypothetical protein
MTSIGSRIAITAAFLIAAAGTAWGISPEDKCKADKLKIAGKFAFCRQQAEVKGVKKGLPPDYTKCDAKLLGEWAKAEQKAIGKGTSCIDSITGTAIQSFVASHTGAVLAALNGGSLGGGAFMLLATGETTSYGTGTDGDVQSGAALSYSDNGDGTITDNNTGLTWEKKVKLDSTADLANLNDADNCYYWSGLCTGDGTTECLTDADCSVAGGTCLATLGCGGSTDTIFQWLEDLNAANFGGHNDWRIPNVRELQSIVDHGSVLPSVGVAFQGGSCGGACADIADPACSCTGQVYWSSTTSAFDAADAWYIGFESGVVFGDDKRTFPSLVRAVRGGL